MEMYLVFCFDQINLSQDNAIRVYIQIVSMCSIVFDQTLEQFGMLGEMEFVFKVYLTKTKPKNKGYLSYKMYIMYSNTK